MTKPKRKKFCIWKEDMNGIWETTCRDEFVLNDGSPLENKMKFCCYCGARLKEKRYEA